MSIGQRIKQIRKLNQYTQVDFASLVGVSQGTLSELEQNRYAPSIEVLIEIHSKFKINLEWLIFGEKQSNSEKGFSLETQLTPVEPVGLESKNLSKNE